MRKVKDYLLPSIGFLALVVALVLASPITSNAVPSEKDVRVINTPLEPVPTAAQGTTNIAGSVSISGTPTVNLGAGSNVGITNTTANPVPVFNVNASIQPFQATAGTTEVGGNVSTVIVATVPAGKRLVIEWVTMTAQIPAGQNMDILEIATNAGLGGINHQLLIHSQPPANNGDDVFRANQDLKLYADAGTQVRALFRRSSVIGTANYHLAISGYLVDL